MQQFTEFPDVMRWQPLAAGHMKLHWGPMSPFVRKVLITAHETGLVERITLVRSLVAMNAANPNVMLDNPLSKIPTLVKEDGSALFDSDVICEYLDGLHFRARLIPAEGEARWRVLRWNAFASGVLDALVLWRNERMRPEECRSVPTLETYALKIAACLKWAEREIQGLEASAFSLGHISMGCMFGYMDLRFGDLEWRASHPASARWFETFMKRDSAKRTDPALADTPQTQLAPSTPQSAELK
jgi:glutathione S-transferase